MTRQTEDTMYQIYTEIDKLGIRPEFEAQVKKMDKQKNINGKMFVKHGSTLSIKFLIKTNSIYIKKEL